MSSSGERRPRARIGLDELETDPHPVLAALRERAPVAWVEPLRGWLVTSRELAVRVMRDAETFTVDDPRFSTAQVIGPSMLSLDGEDHARHRAPFEAPFRGHAIRDRLAGVVERTARRLVGELAPIGRADLLDAVAGPLAVRSVAALLGLPPDRDEALRKWYAAIVDAVTDISAGRPPAREARRGFEELSELVTSRVVTAGVDEGDSLVADAATGLDTDEVVSNAAVILFGGIETSEGMIANALWHLLSHPDQLALVRHDRDLVPGAVEESLRLEPAAARVDRYATRDVGLADAEVRAGDLVVVSLTAANRDPEAVADPDRFDVTRPDAARHLAFAHGPHACIGAGLARMEGVAAVEAVLDLLPGARLDDERARPPGGLVFRKPARLPVRWEPQPPPAGPVTGM